MRVGKEGGKCGDEKKGRARRRRLPINLSLSLYTTPLFSFLLSSHLPRRLDLPGMLLVRIELCPKLDVYYRYNFCYEASHQSIKACLTFLVAFPKVVDVDIDIVCTSELVHLASVVKLDPVRSAHRNISVRAVLGTNTSRSFYSVSDTCFSSLADDVFARVD